MRTGVKWHVAENNGFAHLGKRAMIFVDVSSMKYMSSIRSASSSTNPSTSSKWTARCPYISIKRRVLPLEYQHLQSDDLLMLVGDTTVHLLLKTLGLASAYFAMFAQPQTANSRVGVKDPARMRFYLRCVSRFHSISKIGEQSSQFYLYLFVLPAMSSCKKYNRNCFFLNRSWLLVALFLQRL